MASDLKAAPKTIGKKVAAPPLILKIAALRSKGGKDDEKRKKEARCAPSGTLASS